MDIDEAFVHTFNALFGKGEGTPRLGDFRDYLLEYSLSPRRVRSVVSGKDVTTLTDEYCRDARFISQDEVRELSKPFDINEIKDIDSILRAVEDRLLYTGNKTSGNTQHVENVDICMDSFHVRESTNVQESKYIAFSNMIRTNSEFVFGSTWMGRARYIIRTQGAFGITRCFESYYVVESSDCHFSYNCSGCNNLMFSFNQRGGMYLVGNRHLEKDRYTTLKEKLMSEVREKLMKDKRFPSLFSLIRYPEKHVPPGITVSGKKDFKDLDAIERAFRSTTKLIFGKEMGPISRFENWLLRHSPRNVMAKTPYGNVTYIPSTYNNFMKEFPKDRIITDDEAIELGKRRIELDEEEELDFESIGAKLPKIAYFSPEIITGKCSNFIETPITVNSANVYKVVDATNSKYSAVSGQTFNSDYIFGSSRAMHSHFCINCYHSLDLTNCFEMDSCSHCRDSMFCHNCENLDNCMFCFNVKSKRYAIGNVEVGKEAYLRVKEKLMKAIAEKLEKEGKLEWDIYNVGCVKAKGDPNL